MKEASLMPLYVLSGSTLIVLTIVFWKISMLLVLIGGAVYGYKVLSGQITHLEPSEAVEAPIERKKRSYNRRVTVNHYQAGKVKI